MESPDRTGAKSEPAALAFLNIETEEKFVREEKEGDRRRHVAQNAGEMITARFENMRGIIGQVREPLDRPVKIRRSGVQKEKMLEGFRDELPASDKRVAQD